MHEQATGASEKVTRLPETRLQRACACAGGCARCETKPPDYEPVRLQRKRVGASDPGESAVPPIVSDGLRSPDQPLDVATRAIFEPRFGYDFSGVRLHTSAKAAESARAVNALAYTMGRDIVFGAGQYAPETSAGRALLAHELTHVIQQSQAQPASQPLAISSPVDTEEREADSVVNAFVVGGPMPTLSSAPLAIDRQPVSGSGQSGKTQTITDPNAVVRGGPPDFKATGDPPIAVGTRVDIIDTQVSTKPKGTFVNLVEHGTGKALGWTMKMNLGDAQYEKAAASFVYVAKVQPRKGHPDTLPVMVYVPPNFDGKNATTVDAVLYFHGDAADYAASEANNYKRENPAIGMNLAGVKTSANRIIIAPQINEWQANGPKDEVEENKNSPWYLLQAGDYEAIVKTVFTNLQSDYNNTSIKRGTFSIAGHSGGGKALGQAVQDLDSSGSGVVTDITLVEAGYRGGEGDGYSFSKSFQMVRDWLLVGKPDKVLRVISKESSPGTATRHAIENDPDSDENKKGRVPVLGLTGVRNAIKAKKLDDKLQAVAKEDKDTVKRTGGMELIRKIVVSRKDGGKDQGAIYVFLMTKPPRGKDVDPHFGVREATIGDIASGSGKGDDFAATP